eukprot:6185780-Pleurochrysis_carterae.AAC.5
MRHVWPHCSTIGAQDAAPPETAISKSIHSITQPQSTSGDSKEVKHADTARHARARDDSDRHCTSDTKATLSQ